MIVALTTNVRSHSTRALLIIYPWEVTKLALLHRLYLSFGPADSYCEFLIRLDIWIENSCAVQKFSLATMEHLKGIGTLFYVIDPYSTMYEKISDLPHPDFMSKVLVQILQLHEITKKNPLDCDMRTTYLTKMAYIFSPNIQLECHQRYSLGSFFL